MNSPSYTATALLTAMLSSMAAAPAVATDRAAHESPQTVVRYDDLDLTTDAGARALYERIADAARRVCPDDNGVRDLVRTRNARVCRDTAIARAIEDMGNEKLAAIQQAPKRRMG